MVCGRVDGLSLVCTWDCKTALTTGASIEVHCELLCGESPCEGIASNLSKMLPRGQWGPGGQSRNRRDVLGHDQQANCNGLRHHRKITHLTALAVR